MPLIGKLTTGKLQELLDEMKSSQRDGHIKLSFEHRSATLRLQTGELQELSYEHQNMEDSLEQLCGWTDGVFHVYYPGEQEFPQSVSPLWLVIEDRQQLQQIREELQPLPYPLWVFSDLQEMSALLEEFPPQLLMVDSHQASSLLPTLFQAMTQHNLIKRTRILLLGEVPADFQAPPVISFHQLSWPAPPQMLNKTLQTLLPTPMPLPKAIEPAQPDAERTMFELLSAVTPSLPDDLSVQLHGEQRQNLEQLQVSPAWRQWLFSLDANYPVTSYLPHCPGSQEQASVLLRYLLQLGILTNKIPFASMLTKQDNPLPPQLISPLTSQDNPLPPQSTGIHTHVERIIALGLRGQWKEDWIFSLQQISQHMLQQGLRNSSVHIPYVPKAEFARVPLPNNALLLLYGLITDDKIEALLGKIGGTVDAFLFFVDASNETEIAYAQGVRERLLQKYAVPYTVILAHPSLSPEETNFEPLKLHEQEKIVLINRLDEDSTNRVLYELLQQFPQHKNALSAPPPLKES